MRGYYGLLREKPSSLFKLPGYSSIYIAVPYIRISRSGYWCHETGRDDPRLYCAHP